MILALGVDPVLPGPLLVLVALLFLSFPVYSYVRRKGNEVSLPVVGRLIGIRALALALLFLLGLRPYSQRTEELVETAGLVLLVDTSKSMGVRDMPDGATRARALEAFWSETLALRADLAEDFDLSIYTFDEALAETEGAVFEPTGDSTAIGNALEGVRGRPRTGRLAGIVVFSDGSQNAGQSPLTVAERHEGEGVRVDTVVVGSDEPSASLRDVQLRGLYFPNRVHSGMEVAVEVDLTCLAAQGSWIELECTLEGAGREVVRLEIDRPRLAQRVAFPALRVRGKGKKHLVVRATRLRDEVSYSNNVIEDDVHVIKDRSTVLLVEGYLRWETKFLLRSLAGARLLEVVPIYGPGPTEAALLARKEWLADFDVVIVGDVGAGRLPGAFLQNLRELSLEGQGVLFLGGAAAYGAGGYAGTPIEVMLPIRIAGGNDRVEGEWRAQPTDAGRTHFACRLEEDPVAARAAWDRLPPMVDRHRPASVKPGGSILVEAGGGPLLVVQNYGEGRTAAFLADSTWRWFFTEKDTAAHHRRFWRQLALWLAGRDVEGDGSVTLSLDPNRSLFDPGQSIGLEAIVLDGRGNDIENARVELELFAPEGGEDVSRRLVFEPDPDTGQGTFRTAYVPTAPGEYRVTVRAWRGGDEVGSDERKFKVRQPAGELDDPVARPELLAEIATAAGGRCVPLAQAGSILEEIRDAAGGVAVTRQVVEPVWSNAWILFAFVGLITLEWILRKRHGMV